MKSPTRIVIIVLITLVLGGGLGYELYLIKTAQTQVALATESADVYIGSDSRVRKIVEIQESSKEDVTTLDQTLLTKSDLVSLVERIEKVGKDLDLSVSISSITNDAKTSSSANPETVRVSVEGRGSWSSNLSFIKLLESLPHKVSFDRVDLTYDLEVWRSNVTLRLVIYPQR